MGATRVGNTLGGFRILECLGSGGAGTIWKAEDLSLGRIVAIKALRQDVAADASMAARFRSEARALARLSHANVASLFSLLEDDDGLYLVLEYVEGNTLSALLATSGPLPFDSAFALFHQVLDGVGHAHDAGIVHRDLKSSNLMVDARGRVKVMDFGIARMAGAQRTTHHGKLVGTPEYMSPEQVRGEDATIRSDIYSLGIVLYEMLTGRTPFRAVNSFEMMRAQLEEAPVEARVLRPDLDPRVGAALRRALAKRPAERFATTHELQETLLDAGASPRGRTIVPVWQELAPQQQASEAETLLTQGPPTENLTVEGMTTKLLDAAFADAELSDPLDDEFESPRSHASARANATEVIDTSEDTEGIQTPGGRAPVRELDDAASSFTPSSAPSSARERAPERAGARSRRVRWEWAVAAVAVVALGVGIVRLTAKDPPSRDAPKAPQNSESEPAPFAPALPPPTIEIAAPSAPAASEEAVAETAPKPAKPRTQPKRAEAKRPAAKPATAPAPADSGWVIRR